MDDGEKIIKRYTKRQKVSKNPCNRAPWGYKNLWENLPKSTGVGACAQKSRFKHPINEKRRHPWRKMEQIAVEMDYSIQHVFRIHSKALEKIKFFLK